MDDDKDHLMLFKLVLEDGGYSVDAYTDPYKALSKFRPNYYDLVLCKTLSSLRDNDTDKTETIIEPVRLLNRAREMAKSAIP